MSDSSGSLHLHLHHLIASCMTNYDWLFRTLPFGLFGQIWTQGTSRHILGPILLRSGHFLSVNLNHLKMTKFLKFSRCTVILQGFPGVSGTLNHWEVCNLYKSLGDYLMY